MERGKRMCNISDGMKEKNMENRAFLEMRKEILVQLANRDPIELAENAGVIYDDNVKQFSMHSFGEKIVVSYPEFEIKPEIENWSHLLILHYLDKADGTPFVNERMALGNMKNGLVRGTKFEHHMEQSVSNFFRGKTEEEIWLAFEKLGAVKMEGKADLCLKTDFLPNFPVFFNIWFEDDEFPTSVKLLVDQSADHYLTIEDAVTLGEILLQQLMI